MKNKIVVCISDKHELYNKFFDEGKIKIGKGYRCINSLILTSEGYFKPEFASLRGITIINGVDRFGWRNHCFPSECFRVATKKEIRKYKILFRTKMPFYLCKIYFFKAYCRIDRVIRAKYYKRISEMYL